MAEQSYTVILQVVDDHVDPDALPPEVDVRRAASGRTELVVRVTADDPVDALARVEYMIDGQPLTVATLRVMPHREFRPDEDGAEPLPVFLTVPDAATRLDISQQRVRQLIESGHGLRATKVGRDWLIPESDIERRQKRMAARKSFEEAVAESRAGQPQQPTMGEVYAAQRRDTV